MHMTRIRVLGLAVVTVLASAASAAANPVPLLAAAIQGFLLSSTTIAATLTGTIATVAANAIIAGSAEGGVTMLSRRADDRR